MNNYIKIKEIKSDYIVGQVVGDIFQGDLVELYDNLKNPLGIYTSVKTILYFGIDYDSIQNGYEASFYLPGLSNSLLDTGMYLVRD